MRGWEALLGVSRPDLETEFQGRPSKPGHSGAELLLAGANDQVLQNCFRLLAVAGGGGGGGGGWCTRLASVAKWKPGQGSASPPPPPPHFVKGCIRSAQLPQSPGRWAAGTRSHPALIITHQPTTSNTITFLGGVAGRVGNEPFMRFEVAKSQRRFPTRAFNWFNVAITAFAFKNL